MEDPVPNAPRKKKVDDPPTELTYDLSAPATLP
jgi:hypothetical protein